MAIYEVPDDNRILLFTKVKNASASTTFFGFLPPFGRRLATGEAIYVWGDIRDWIVRFSTGEDARESLLSALDSGAMTIEQTPVVVITNPYTDSPDIVAIDDSGDLVNLPASW